MNINKKQNHLKTTFNVGELIKRKTLSDGQSRAVCVVVDKVGDNYTLYNNSLKCLQTVANVVVEGLYHKVYSRQ
jgi:hypothetical protein